MPHPRLAFHSWPAAVYAVGDVHGCLDQLLALEDDIVSDSGDIEGEKWLVTLGDHIDRGPNSREVVTHVMQAAPAGFRRFALLGNHEVLALDFLATRDWGSNWLHPNGGGRETLLSYGIDPSQPGAQVAALFPSSHLIFFANLPLYLSLPGWLFVHAGIRPGLPLSAQAESDLVWIRDPFLNSQLTGGLRVVHGHTPVENVVITPHRIDVDTACFATGRLSAVRVTPDGRTKVISVQGPIPVG